MDHPRQLQHRPAVLLANGTLEGPGGTKDTVASGTVMKKSDGTLSFLGGQNMFDVFVPAGAFATGKNKTQYDETMTCTGATKWTTTPTA